jgi:hypothetical protein
MGILRITSDQLKGEHLLGEGAMKVGRSRDNDVRLAHKSVSRHHAVITEEDGRLLIKDLASTYGTYINEDKTNEGFVEDGDVVRFGRIRMVYQANLEPVPASANPPSPPQKIASVGAKEEDDQAPEMATAPVATATGGSAAQIATKPCEKHPSLNVSLICPKCHLKFCTDCVKTIEVSGQPRQLCPYCKESCSSIARHQAKLNRQQARERSTILKSLPEILKYPFTSDGIWLLLIGTLIYLVLDFIANFDVRVAVVASGYLLAYLHKILVSAANGDEELPGWPDFADWWQEIVRPCLMIIWAGVISFLPLLIYLGMLYSESGDAQPSILFPLGAWGILYLPLAALAVPMSQNFIIVNPIAIGQAMVKLTGQYMFASVLLLSMIVVRYFLDNLFVAYISVPTVPTVLTGLVTLYFLAIEVRLLGIIYYLNRRQLGWSES